MTDARSRPSSSSPAGTHGRRYRRGEVTLSGGGRLLLEADGTIRRIDAEGSTVRSWTPSDPDWPNQAIRFGLRPEPTTVAPHGQRIPNTGLPGA
jgi:hypothetical protein